MIRYLYIVTLLLASCGQTKNRADQNKVANSDSTSKAIENTPVNNFPPTDKTIKFLWRADKYDETLKDTFNSIFH